MADATPTEQPTVTKRNDAYTGLLAISFLAMVGGTVLLYLDYQNYEGKTPPAAPKIDVPGVQLKALPNTGGPPKIVEPPKPMEEPMPPPEMPKEKEPEPKPPEPKAMRGPEFLPPETPIAIPAEPIVRVRAEDPTIAIPDAQPQSNVVPATAIEPAKTAPPIIPNLEPNLSDAPPVSTKRFDPPK